MQHGNASKTVRPERTGWRDENLSARHRRWGWDCPAVDIDFLLIEYDHGKAVALVEYKHEKALPQKASHPSYRALIDLSSKATIPFFVARYADDFSWWKIIPLNRQAKKVLPERTEMNERQWVTFLYKIRGSTPPESLFDGVKIK